MRTWMKSMAAAITLAGAALAVQQAQAGCGVPDAGNMKPTAYFDDGRAGFLKAQYEGGGPFTTSAIAGLWQVSFISDGRNPGPGPGALADSGFAVWHDDGTEIMNSGRAPVSGSFCMGVWKQTGPYKYQVNHWALGWIPGYVPNATGSWTAPNPANDQSVVGGVDGAFAYVGPTNIQEWVTLSRDHKTFTGTFKITVYQRKGPPATTPVYEYDPASTPLQVITGTLTGTRVTVD